VPITILSATTATPEELAERDKLVSDSSKGKHIQVRGTGHWIQLDAPDVVVSALYELWQDISRP
jgi:pimeloyl-ACP methyl ester carboxylesterase